MKILKQKLSSFDDACKVEGITNQVPFVDHLPETYRTKVIADYKLLIIIAAANRLANRGKAWKPDCNNNTDHKFSPWFYVDSVSGFQFCGTIGWPAPSIVSSRLCTIANPVGKYVANTFLDLYKESFLI